MLDLLLGPFAEFGFLRRALVGCMALSLAAPPLGVFLMLRRMSLIGRIVTKLLGNEDRQVVRDDRNASTASPIGRLVTKILRK